MVSGFLFLFSGDALLCVYVALKQATSQAIFPVSRASQSLSTPSPQRIF